MGVIAKGIPRTCQGLFTPVSLGYPLSLFNKNSTLKRPSSAPPGQAAVPGCGHSSRVLIIHVCLCVCVPLHVRVKMCK